MKTLDSFGNTFHESFVFLVKKSKTLTNNSKYKTFTSKDLDNIKSLQI
jgi:hypothetical protein